MEKAPSDQLQRRFDIMPALGVFTLLLVGVATFGIGMVAASPQPASVVRPAATPTLPVPSETRIDPTPTPAASVSMAPSVDQQSSADQAAADAAAKQAADAARAAARSAAQKAAAQRASDQQPTPVVTPPAPVASDPTPDPSSSPSAPAGCDPQPAPDPCATPSS